MDIVSIQTRGSEKMDWKSVFASNLSISESYAMQYMDLNYELGWTKYRIVYSDGSVKG